MLEQTSWKFEKFCDHVVLLVRYRRRRCRRCRRCRRRRRRQTGVRCRLSSKVAANDWINAPLTQNQI